MIFKILAAAIFCNIYRLWKFFPNNDPIMGTMLPFAKHGTWWEAGFFAFITMTSFDFFTGNFGSWTLITAGTYGALGMWFQQKFSKMEKVDLSTYITSALAGVLIYDAVTGPIMSSLMWGMSFGDALFGQIPFTIWHLFSVGIFTLILTPLLDHGLIGNKAIGEGKSLWAWIKKLP